MYYSMLNKHLTLALKWAKFGKVDSEVHPQHFSLTY